MKTAISIPDPVFRAAEEVAQRLALSRSQLYTKAIQEFVELHAQSDVTERLNRVYSEVTSGLDPVVAELQWRSLEAQSW